MEGNYAPRRKLKRALIAVCVLAAAGIAALALYLAMRPGESAADIEENYTSVFMRYAAGIEAGAYQTLYDSLSAASRIAISEDAFVTRLSRIYTGIEAANLHYELIEVITPDPDGEQEDALKRRVFRYRVRMDTVAGAIAFESEATVSAYPIEEGEGFRFLLDWDHDFIFPNLTAADSVSVKTIRGERGSIFDRDGVLLAGPGIVKSVGIVPGKMSENPEERALVIAQYAEILGMSVESIEKKLSEKWVRPEHFVPLKSLSELDITRKEQLLALKGGIRIDDAIDRVYPLGEKAAHLVGYIQPINAQELEARAGQGYSSQSRIGKLGLEALLEDRIRGIDGSRIAILDELGGVKEVLLERPAVNGEDIYTTIDSGLQARLYEQLRFDKAAATVLNPYTGEVLALLSTPAYDPNEFVLGVPDPLWEEWNTSPMRPLYNRFKAVYAPGSSFKAITAAIGLSTGAFTAGENFGHTGKSWQKDSSWGSYTVTTLKEYGSDVSLNNAMIYSDNIYFARAALKIGAQRLAEEFLSIGFEEELPFTFGLTRSSFGQDGAFGSEIELADSGYGQGRVQVNVLHMASLYSAFLHEGSMIRPYLIQGDAQGYWKESAFTAEAANAVRDALVAVVEDADGTGHEARVEGKLLAGKTGTAEIKLTKDDETGTELGWFVCFPARLDTQTPYLTVCMVEDVKGRGGSHYVIPMVRALY